MANHFISNPFELFNIPPSYALDLSALDRAYFKMQREFHPDKQGKTADFSSSINAAYQTLKNPVKRAEVLLEILGILIPGEDGESVDTSEWLLDIFDFQEAIMVCASAEEAVSMKNEIDELFGEEQHYFNDCFDKGLHDELPESYVKLSYLSKLKNQLSEVEEQFYHVKQAVH